MTHPTNITTDFSVMAAYVEYRPGVSSVETVDLNDTGSVAYDLDSEGEIIGIEILGFDHPEQVEIARAFAVGRDLAFPRDLAAT